MQWSATPLHLSSTQHPAISSLQYFHYLSPIISIASVLYSPSPQSYILHYLSPIFSIDIGFSFFLFVYQLRTMYLSPTLSYSVHNSVLLLYGCLFMCYCAVCCSVCNCLGNMLLAQPFMCKQCQKIFTGALLCQKVYNGLRVDWSLWSRTNEVGLIKVTTIDSFQNHAFFLKTMVTNLPPFWMGPVQIVPIAALCRNSALINNRLGNSSTL